MFRLVAVLLPAAILVASVGAVAGAAGSASVYVSIWSSADPVEVGIDFELKVVTAPTDQSLLYNWSDSLGGTSAASTWQLAVNVPGNLTVQVVVSDLLGVVGQANLTIGVRPHLSVGVGSAFPQVDAGVATSFFINVSGGVGPYLSEWLPADGGPNGSAQWLTEGKYFEPVTFWTPGPGWVVVRVADTLGGFESLDQQVAEVVPPGTFEIATNGSVAEAGWPLGVAAAVEAGTPPFQWTLTSSVPFAGGSESFGEFAADGMYRWNVSFAWAGTAILNLTVVDATGALQAVSTTVSVEPPLAVVLPSPGLGSADSLTASVNVSGGLAPYTCVFHLSDGEQSVVPIAGAGSASTGFSPGAPGTYTVEIQVMDALGRSTESTESVRIAGATGPVAGAVASGTPIAAVVGGVAALLLLGGAVLWFRSRSRGRPPSADEASALPAVRQLMRQSQIIDRETLLSLGEEAGESPEAVQAAIDTLIRTGEVRTETGPTHEEVLHWRTARSPAEPPEGGP